MVNFLFYFLPILSFCLGFTLVLFYIDDFNLSTNKYIRFLQILSFLLLIVLVIWSFMETVRWFNNGLFIIEDGNKDPKVSIDVGATVIIDKDAAKEISKGIGYLGSNIGLAGTTGAIAGSVSKVIVKSSLPPVQKVGIVLGGAAVGAGIHVAASALNRLNSLDYTTKAGDSTSNTKSLVEGSDKNPLTTRGGDSTSNINNLLDGYDYNTDLQSLILGIDMISIACLGLVLILFMIILFKNFLNEDKINLNFSSLIGDKANSSLNYYLIKLIKINKKTTLVYIIIIFIILFIALAFNCYFIDQLYTNLDKYINIHINSRK